MSNDELLALIDKEVFTIVSVNDPSDIEIARLRRLKVALRAVVELIQEKQKFLENTKGDIPMTNQQLGAREERTKLLAEIKQAIEKELK